jgi:hypothetical protein
VFRVVDVPEALPGQCYFCGSASKEKYLDFGTSQEFYGALYGCNECMFAAAKLLGFLSPIEVETLVREHRERSEALSILQIQHQALEEAMQNLVVAGFGNKDKMVTYGIDDRGSMYTLDDSGVPAVLDASEQSDEDESRESASVDSGTPGNDESSDDEGMEFVSSSSTRSEPPSIS